MAYLGAMNPDLIADLILYPSEEGGRKTPMKPGIRCPAFAHKETSEGGWTCQIDFEGDWMKPGESRRARFKFLLKEGAELMRGTGKFFLWDGKFFGEANIVAE